MTLVNQMSGHQIASCPFEGAGEGAFERRKRGALASPTFPSPTGRRAASGAATRLRMALLVDLPTLEKHPLYLIDQQFTKAIQESQDWQCAYHEEVGARSIHPVCIIRASLLQALYSFRCDLQFTEQLQYNLLYRWFVGLGLNDRIWDAAVYTQARRVLQRTASGGSAFRGVLLKACTLAQMWPMQFRIDEDLFDAWIDSARPLKPESLRHEISIPGEDSSAAAATLSIRSRGVRLDKALAVIMRRIREPGLRPEAVAAAVCMSRRSLYMLFKEHGLTPKQTIYDLRLERCKRALSDPSQHSRKIIDIAEEFGFGDVSTFSRLFKRRYGITPRDARIPPFMHQKRV